MECAVCGIVYGDDGVIQGKYGCICVDCAKKLLGDIVDVLEKHERQVAAELIVRKLVEARLLPAEVAHL